MGDDSKWKRRLHTRIYDYNYKVSEGYYKPQSEFSEIKQYSGRCANSPPKHQSYAERFASSPWYGGTKGLPYSETSAASKESLIKLSDRHMRSSSLLREMKELAEEDVPLNVRASRRKKRFEEEEERLGIRPRHFSVESKAIRPVTDMHSKIQTKIRNLDDELFKSARTASTVNLPSNWNYELDRPAKVTESVQSYSVPSSESRLNRFSRNLISHYDSSKPPISNFRSRKISFSDETKLEPRMRMNSTGDFTAMPKSSRRSSEVEANAFTYMNRAPKIREHLRTRASREITEDINSMVDKLRVRKENPQAPITRSYRTSSVERHPRSRRGSYSSGFVYGI